MIKYREILIILIVLLVILRFYNLREWLLANLDEISLLNNLNIPLLKGGFASTTFFFYVILTKILFFINTFPEYRYISVSLNLLGVFIAYKTGKIITDKNRALFLVLIILIHWYFVYITRLYEIGALTPFFTSLILYFYFKWEDSKKDLYLFLTFIVGGLGFDNHVPPMVYFLAALSLWVLYQTIKKHVKISTLVYCIILFLIVVSPYIYVITSVSGLEKGITFFYPSEKKSGFFLANISNPQIFLKTLTELLTFYQTQIPWEYFLILAIFIVSIPFIVSYKSKRNNFLNFLYWQTYVTLFLIIISVSHAYNEGHFSSFLMVFIFLLVKLTENKNKLLRYSIFSVIFVLCFFGMLFIPRIFENQYKQIEWLPKYISDNKIKEVLISDGAYLSLKYTPFLKNVNSTIFYCNPINGISDKNLKNYKLVIATNDCNIQEYFMNNKLNLKEIIRLNTLIEVHLSHGPVFYEVIK